MNKKTAVICGVCLGMLLTGCGAKTTPEIIMPEEPMTSAVGSTEGVASNAQQPDAQQPAAAPVAEQASESASGDGYTIYLITMDLADNHWKSIDEGCQAASAELGNITYKWIAPDVHDDALQSACIDEAVADGANAILLAANSAEGVNGSLQKAADAGCKLVYVDSAATFDAVATFATDNMAAGECAGDAMKQVLQDKGITSGTIGIMGITKDTVSCVAREEGFRKAFEGTDYTLADTVFMQDQVDNVRNAVRDGIADNYIAFFGTNEGTTEAIGDTVKEKGAQSAVVGFDTSDSVLSLVSEGIVFATMQQNPYTMGYEGLKAAVEALEGSNTQTNVKTDTGVTVITKESI